MIISGGPSKEKKYSVMFVRIQNGENYLQTTAYKQKKNSEKENRNVIFSMESRIFFAIISFK
jgi:hypothetical protein